MLQLRPANNSDYEYAKRVHHTAYREMIVKQFGKWEEHVQDHFFDKSWNSLSYDIIIFENEPCGYCSIQESENAIQLMEFAVDISKQAKGIGSMLLAKFKEMGREKRKVAQLNVMKTNEKAKALYERLGFSVYGENHFQFLMRENDVL
ncbi:MAG: GNAT family N-acetyltransferase [Pseudomonadota bacterium]